MNQKRSASIQGAALEHGRVVPLKDIFVSIDLDDDIAYIAHEGATGIRWAEVSRAQGELLARVGAHAQIHLGLDSLIGRSSTVRLARRSA